MLYDSNNIWTDISFEFSKLRLIAENTNIFSYVFVLSETKVKYRGWFELGEWRSMKTSKRLHNNLDCLISRWLIPILISVFSTLKTKRIHLVFKTLNRNWWLWNGLMQFWRKKFGIIKLKSQIWWRSGKPMLRSTLL